MFKIGSTNIIINRYLTTGLICFMALLFGCNNTQTPSDEPPPNSQNEQSSSQSTDHTQQQKNSGQDQNSRYLGDSGLNTDTSSSATNEGQASSERNSSVFSELNITFKKDYCGIWQLYKRKPHDEPERLISENQYLDLKSDYSYQANSWTINGKGSWVPAFNWKSSGGPLNFLLFTNTKYNRPDITTVSAELIEQNNTQMLKITELEEGDTDYYIRKQ